MLFFRVETRQGAATRQFVEVSACMCRLTYSNISHLLGINFISVWPQLPQSLKCCPCFYAMMAVSAMLAI